jgi:hypothetical protein
MWKLIDTLRGIGDVFEGGEPIGSVSYTLEVYREYAPAQDRVLEGPRRIEGKAKPADGIDLAELADNGTPLTLHLEDGQLLEFFFQSDGSVVPRHRGLYHPNT